jgi:hypothetical protein
MLGPPSKEMLIVGSRTHHGESPEIGRAVIMTLSRCMPCPKSVSVRYASACRSMKVEL